MLPRLATPAIRKSIEADAYSYRDAFFAGSYRFIACRIRVRNSNRARSDRVRTRGDRDQAHSGKNVAIGQYGYIPVRR